MRSQAINGMTKNQSAWLSSLLGFLQCKFQSSLTLFSALDHKANEICAELAHGFLFLFNIELARVFLYLHPAMKCND